ncbi:hypothetical protein CEXT_461031 [Caerostris extrusa]|uniref:Uncharacterized protein n=1 Tax=Caerostris extrusa TaxID=172846 RepID=A0AAV4SEH5_CAEEX|nr:hypothetical protein CEXT_461031 [Caerostris extrusa]
MQQRFFSCLGVRRNRKKKKKRLENFNPQKKEGGEPLQVTYNSLLQIHSHAQNMPTSFGTSEHTFTPFDEERRVRGNEADEAVRLTQAGHNIEATVRI